MTQPRILVSILVCLVAGCATQTAQTSDTPLGQAAASVPARGSANVITAAELSDPALGDIDALSIIKRLRPAFLQTRGPSSANTPGAGDVHVSIDGGPLSSTTALTTVHAREILEIRYLSTTAAAQVYGSLSGAGPVITLRRK